MPKMRTMMKKEDSSAVGNNGVGGGGGRVKEVAWQSWHRNGTRCPRGTVPVRRTTVHDILRSKSLFDFGKKQRRLPLLARRSDAPDVVSGNGHEVH